MKKFDPFESFAQEYDEWFDKNRFVYESELNAVKELLPNSKNGIEVGVGSGRFAAPFNIKVGVDPSKEMAVIAQKRGIKVIEGVAESLPFLDSQFDFVLMVDTIYLLEDIKKSFKEAYRVLKPDGYFIIGFIDAQSSWGKYYEEHKKESKFSKYRKFYSVKEVISRMENVHFKDFQIRQTLFQPFNQIKQIEDVKMGYGKGSFVVLRGSK